MFDKVVGGSVLCVGDLHFSDVFKGRHIDYLKECFEVLASLTTEIESSKPAAVVLLGDIIGWTETNIKNRQVLSEFCKVLRGWKNICPVYAVRGNHDLRGYPDFNFLAELGMIITGSACGGYFDFYGSESQEVPEVRFHLVDYKDEDRQLNLRTDGCSNIVLGHNNYMISGITGWYPYIPGVELGRLSNFNGVDMVISGHIHVPSPEVVMAGMPDGGSCMLFYPGSPTRPTKERGFYDSCWLGYFNYNPQAGSTLFEPKRFDLQPISEVIYPDEDFIDEDSVKETSRKEALADILNDLLKYRLNQGDPIEQVMRIPNASDRAKEIACKYLRIAFGGTEEG